MWNCVWPSQPGLYTRDDTHRIQWLKWRRLHRRPWWCPAAQTRGRERGCCDASCYQSVRAGCCQRWSTDPFLENNMIGVKVLRKMTLDKLKKKTPYLQSCKILDLIASNDVNFTTCNSHRMGRPNVYVNYLLDVQRSWLNRSVGINFFHLVWGVRFLSVGYFIQAKFVKPGRKKKSRRQYYACYNSREENVYLMVWQCEANVQLFFPLSPLCVSFRHTLWTMRRWPKMNATLFTVTSSSGYSRLHILPSR